MLDGFLIGDRRIAPTLPSLIIAEIAQAHDGSLGLAHAYIDAVARAGADAVKFQTHIAAAESSPLEQFRMPFSKQDATRFEYWKRMEFTREQWHGLAQHAREKGLIFLSSPFSLEAVDLLTEIGVPAWKIASGEIMNTPLLERIARTKKPVLISTGMSPIEEIDGAVEIVKSKNLPFLVFQCTSIYPCPAEKVGLNLIPFFRERYGAPVGLSDHSGTIYPGLAAAVIGVEMIEVHVTLSREMFGPDVSSSLTSAELKQLVEGVRFIEKMKANPVDKVITNELQSLRDLFTKSIVISEDLPSGTVLEARHLAFRKPGTGIPAARYRQVFGCRLKRDLAAGTFLSVADLEQLEDA